MPLYDYECQKCGHIFEEFAGIDDTKRACVVCSSDAKRIITATGAYTANDDVAWARDAVEVVNKRSSKPETQEFLKNPTRSNLKRHLKANDLRHAERGEVYGEYTGPRLDEQRHVERMAEAYQKRTRIVVRD